MNDGFGKAGRKGGDDFNESVRKRFNDLFGKAIASTMLRQLGEGAFRNPETLRERLKAIFGEKGAKMILEYVRMDRGIAD